MSMRSPRRISPGVASGSWVGQTIETNFGLMKQESIEGPTNAAPRL
jgi:hypothetical protein